MNADGYVILQQLHTPWQEVMVPNPKNSSPCDLRLTGNEDVPGMARGELAQKSDE